MNKIVIVIAITFNSFGLGIFQYESDLHIPISITTQALI